MDKNSPLSGKNLGVDFLDKVISTSALKEAKKSTRDFIYYYEKEKSSAKHFDFGNAMELYLIDRPAFEKQVAIFDDAALIAKILESNPDSKSPRATNAYKLEKSIFDSENAGKYIINKNGEDSMDVIETISKMCLHHPNIDLLFGGNYQDPFEWTCPVTGLKRYSRTDIFKPEEGIIVEIKTDESGDFNRVATNLDYWLQAYDQMTGALESGKMPEVTAFYWFVITKKAPYFIDFYKIELDQLLKVEEIYWSTLRRLKEDLSGDPSKIVWHKLPVSKIVVPNYYK